MKHHLTKTLTVIYVFLMVGLNMGYPQTLISPNAVVSTATKLAYEKKLNGFNQGFPLNRDCNSDDDYNIAPNVSTVLGSLDNQFLFFRFGFGTDANEYQRNLNYNILAGGDRHYYYTCADPRNIFTYVPVNSTAHNTVYNNYTYFNDPNFINAKENIIYPYINALTSGLQKTTVNSNFIVNILNHYRHYTINSTLYDVRTNLFSDTVLIKNITSLSTLNSSAINSAFKEVVNNNLNTFKTLILNKVPATKVEFGNELYNYFWDGPLNFNVDFIGYDENNFIHRALSAGKGAPAIWYKTTSTNPTELAYENRSLRLYALLCKMYIYLLDDVALQIKNEKNESFYDEIYENIQYGIPIAIDLNSPDSGGFVHWTDYMIKNKNVIGFDAFVPHIYYEDHHSLTGMTANTTSDTSTLNTEFGTYKNNMRSIFFNQKIRNTLPSYIHSKFFSLNAAITNPVLWITEWNIISDDGNDHVRKVGNTLLHGMFYYDYLMAFLDINANQNLTTSTSGASQLITVRSRNSIQHANAWAAFCGPNDKSLYALVRFPYSPTLDPSAIKYNAIYHAHSLLLPVLTDDNWKYVNVKNGALTSVVDCDFRLFYKISTSACSSAKEYYLYYNNKINTDYKINLKSLLALPNTSSQVCIDANIKKLYANNLYASMGLTTFRSSDVLTTDPDITIQQSDANITDMQNVIISKTSLGRIYVKVNTYTGACMCSVSGRYSDNNENESDKSDINNFSLKIYPNPANTKDQIIEINNQKKEKTARLEVFNVAGSIALTKDLELNTGNNKLTINIERLPKGSYLYKISTETNSVTEKIIIQ